MLSTLDVQVHTDKKYMANFMTSCWRQGEGCCRKIQVYIIYKKGDSMNSLVVIRTAKGDSTRES